VRVGIAYMHGWNQHIGCVAWEDLMEDLATLEISRAQVWQWLRHGVALDDGTIVTRELVHGIFDEEGEQIGFADAQVDAEAIFTEPRFRPFLTGRSELAGTDLETKRARLRVEGTSGTRAPL
jgi:malate synthase